jgi:hypothetical protein
MFKTMELYICEDRDKQLCMRISCGNSQTRRLVLTPTEADQLTAFMCSVSERYGKEVIAFALDVLKVENGRS